MTGLGCGVTKQKTGAQNDRRDWNASGIKDLVAIPELLQSGLSRVMLCPLLSLRA
jgi:hypothetical protein